MINFSLKLTSMVADYDSHNTIRVFFSCSLAGYFSFIYLFIYLFDGWSLSHTRRIQSPVTQPCTCGSQKKPQFIMSMWYPSLVAQCVHPDHKRLGLWSACTPWASTLKSKEQGAAAPRTFAPESLVIAYCLVQAFSFSFGHLVSFSLREKLPRVSLKEN